MLSCNFCHENLHYLFYKTRSCVNRKVCTFPFLPKASVFLLQVKWVSKEWAKRAALPSHVVTMLDNFPTNLHPMSQFSAAITALNSESNFARAYSEGVHKTKYWEVSSYLLNINPP